MSLEQQIERVATGLEALVHILTAEAKARGKNTVSVAVDAKASDAPTPPKTAAKKPAPVAEPEEVEDIPDEVVSKLTRDLLQKRDRATVVTLLASFGAKKATDLAQEDRPKFVADAKTLLA